MLLPKNKHKLLLDFIQVYLLMINFIAGMIIIHFLLSGPDSESPFEIMRIFTEAGGDASKASVGHMSSN